MTLQRHFEESGNWLFRWRSFLPFLLFLLFIPAIPMIRRPMRDESFQNDWEIFCLLVSLSGLMVRCLVAGQVPPGTSGRNTRSQIANSLNTTGIYSLVRHPLYLGNFLIWLGIAMFCFVPWLIFAFCLIFWLYYERIMFAEEAFLKKEFGEKFVQWASVTPAFIPRFRSYQRSLLPFSWKKAVRKEVITVWAIGLAFLGMDQFENQVVERQFSTERHWIVISIISTLLYLVVRFFKKNTTLFAEGIQGKTATSESDSRV